MRTSTNQFGDCMDWVWGGECQILTRVECPLIRGVRFNNLDFAGATALFTESFDSLESTSEALSKESACSALYPGFLEQNKSPVIW